MTSLGAAIPLIRLPVAACTIAALFISFAPAAAQPAPQPPDRSTSTSEPRAFFEEPDAVERAARFVERRSGGGPENGVYVDFGNMVPGSGWVSAGPGYRHWFDRDRTLFDTS